MTFTWRRNKRGLSYSLPKRTWMTLARYLTWANHPRPISSGRGWETQLGSILSRFRIQFSIVRKITRIMLFFKTTLMMRLSILCRRGTLTPEATQLISRIKWCSKRKSQDLWLNKISVPKTLDQTWSRTVRNSDKKLTSQSTSPLPKTLCALHLSIRSSRSHLTWNRRQLPK